MEKETMKKEDLAISLKHQGYNCCQAILCAFQEETAKLRHDFQNYLLTLRAMPEADSAVNEEREMCL